MTSLNYNQMNLHRVLPLKPLHKFYIYLNNFSNIAYQNPQPSPMSIETTATSMTTIKNEQNKTRHKEKIPAFLLTVTIFKPIPYFPRFPMHPPKNV